MRVSRIACLMLLFFTGLIHAQEVSLVADSWMPYNGDPASKTPGLLIEIAKAVFDQYGFTVRYQTMDWAQAITETRAGKFDGIVGSFKADAPDFVFPASEQAICENRFFAMNDSPWIYTGLPSLDKIRIAVIDGYAYGQIDKYIETYRIDPRRILISNGTSALSTNVDHLNERRVDAVVEESSVMTWFLQDKPYRKEIREAGLVKREKVYLAFSPSPKKTNSKRYAWFMTEGMKKLRASGELAKILSKYGHPDWKPLPLPEPIPGAAPEEAKKKAH